MTASILSFYLSKSHHVTIKYRHLLIQNHLQKIHTENVSWIYHIRADTYIDLN